MRVRSPWLVRFFSRLLFSCGVVLFLLWGMFLLAKGPAYISFEEQQKEGGLYGLHSQSIRLDGKTVTADITKGSQIRTQIGGKSIVLSAPALWDLTAEKEGFLLLEGAAPWQLTVAHNSTGGISRYRLEEVQAFSVDPLASPNMAGTFERLQIFPQVSGGDAYESFVLQEKEITFTVPDGTQIDIYMVYTDQNKRQVRVPVEKTSLPGYEGQHGAGWSFTLWETSVRIEAPEEPLALQVAGRYGLELSCLEVARVQGYLTGELLFQNTNTPRNYVLAEHPVEIVSKSGGLRLGLSRQMGQKHQTENALSVQGEATGMDIGGVDPFPDLGMWFRENVYMAPVSLLSVIVSTMGLTLSQKTQKVKVRKKQNNRDG